MKRAGHADLEAPAVLVRAPGGAYPVYVGLGILGELPTLLRRHLGEPRAAAVVSDPFSGPRFARPLAAALKRAGWKTALRLLPRGEAAKSLREVERLWAFLLRLRAERSTPLIAVGGGTVGDSAGFAAATYRRGIPLVHAPTTLLAQVDSAIGGKTGVNHPLSKNAVGAFHQPSLVACDVDALASLPPRERLSGLAEVVKVALVFDPDFARWLELNWDRLLAGEPRALVRAVRVSVEWKAGVVAADERETRGRRDLLNFGHTAGHALETASGYRLRHGEAVAWGMRVALELSRRRGGFSRHGESALALSLLRRLAPPAWPRDLSLSRALDAMRLDKKVRAGRNVFVLLRGLGRPFREDDVEAAEVREVLESLRPGGAAPRPGGAS